MPADERHQVLARAARRACGGSTASSKWVSSQHRAVAGEMLERRGHAGAVHAAHIGAGELGDDLRIGARTRGRRWRGCRGQDRPPARNSGRRRWRALRWPSARRVPRAQLQRGVRIAARTSRRNPPAAAARCSRRGNAARARLPGRRRSAAVAARRRGSRRTVRRPASREAKLRVNRITPAQASCCSQSRSCAVSSVPATPMTSMRVFVLQARSVAARSSSRPLRIRTRGQGQIVIAQRVGDLAPGPVGRCEGFVGAVAVRFPPPPGRRCRRGTRRLPTDGRHGSRSGGACRSGRRRTAPAGRGHRRPGSGNRIPGGCGRASRDLRFRNASSPAMRTRTEAFCAPLSTVARSLR